MEMKELASALSWLTAGPVALIATKNILDKQYVDAIWLTGAVACVWRASGHLSWTQSVLLTGTVMLIGFGRHMLAAKKRLAGFALYALACVCASAAVLL